MITNKTIKELRQRYGLTQEQLAKALFVDTTTISKYEAGTRKPSVETLELLSNIFGCTVDVVLIKKHKSRSNEDFYKTKDPKTLIELEIEDLTEYLYIKEKDDVLCRICKVNEDFFKRLPLFEQKQLLRDTLDISSKNRIYHILNNTFGGHEDLMIDFIKIIREYIKNDSVLDEDIVNQIYYIEMKAVLWEEENQFVLEDIKFYTKDKELLPVDGSDIDSATLEKYYVQKHLQNGVYEILEKNLMLAIREY